MNLSFVMFMMEQLSRYSVLYSLWFFVNLRGLLGPICRLINPSILLGPTPHGATTWPSGHRGHPPLCLELFYGPFSPLFSSRNSPANSLSRLTDDATLLGAPALAVLLPSVVVYEAQGPGLDKGRKGCKRLLFFRS